MALTPLEHDRKYGELDQVLRAYVGQPADDSEDRPGTALTAYLRHTWHTRPWALADHIRHSVVAGQVPAAPAAPATHWEWHARFPELGQFLGGWFSQDMPDEFGTPDGHDAAVADYRASTDPRLVARLVGEIRELLALGLEESEYAVGAAELGMEVEAPPPYTVSGWLALVAARLT
ncbi:contact-dependent growth inhibition system immunity protein [Actinomycetota bacterium Odt1-20B]